MEYKILVNGEPAPEEETCHTYEFNYSSVHNIRLTISEGKLSVKLQLNMKKKKKAEEIFTEKNNYFSEALKKGMLFHLILYSESLPTKNVRIFIDEEEIKDWKPEESPVIYSLISGKLQRSMSDEWQSADAVFEYFLKNHKTDQNTLAASVYALLYSKAKDNETERFQYLWMAMNGLYTHLAGLKCPGKNLVDREKIRLLEEEEGWGNGAVTKYKPPKKKDSDEEKADEEKTDEYRVVRKIEGVLREPNFERSDIEELVWNELKAFEPADKNEKNKEIKLAGYLKLWYPYYLRCKMFHADKPIPMFSLAKEVEIRRLKFVNDRLEDYLDHNLCKYFNEGSCKQEIGKPTSDT